MTSSQHAEEVRPRKDHCGVDLISDALPFGRLWYGVWMPARHRSGRSPPGLASQLRRFSFVRNLFRFTVESPCAAGGR